MRLLVTGGAGFIGSNFVRRSLESYEGLKITVLDSFTYAGDISNLDGVLDYVDLVIGDIRDGQLVERLIKDCDIVLNFAAETHNDNSLEAPELFVDVNVRGTLNLIQAARKFGTRFHQISTDEVYGDLPFDSTEEFSLASAYRPSSPYSASKASADHLVRAWVRSFNLQATISNCTNNYGMYQHAEKLIPNTINLALQGKRPQIYGLGLNVRDWIHVIDHVDGIWDVINKGVIGETYLFGGSQQLSNISVVQFVLRELNLPDDHIEFVDDRPGHDQKYALDFSQTTYSLGWKPKAPSIPDYMPVLIEFYRNKNFS